MGRLRNYRQPMELSSFGVTYMHLSAASESPVRTMVYLQGTSLEQCLFSFIQGSVLQLPVFQYIAYQTGPTK